MIHLFDTTLRDGTQREGICLSVDDKVRIAHLLDGLGVDYIEAGWPASNPKDSAFFGRARTIGLNHARLVAFGSTRKVGGRAEDDSNLLALLEAETPAVAIFGKSWPLHVTRVLGTTLEENLAMIEDSVAWLKRNGKEVIYDAEHFFDGYRLDPSYALRTLRAAAEGGADWIVLCDTNGGSLPSWVHGVVSAVRSELAAPLGIHTHNDGEMAVANALAAVEAGCTQVQGTINGYGERCGNANLVSLIPALQLKMGHACVSEQSLMRLTELSRAVSEIANLPPDPHAPYVGASAFAHKGGVHVAAVEKVAQSYEHISPERVGNTQRVVVSELSGRGNVRVRASQLGIEHKGLEGGVVSRIKELESQGYQFEAAEGSFELLVRRSQKGYVPPFELLDVVVIVERRFGQGLFTQATVKLRVADEVIHTAAEGEGPVHALDHALRKALARFYPRIKDVRLADYKVRILDPEMATAAKTRVLIEARCGAERWSTIGVSQNIIGASCEALVDSLELHLVRARSEAPELQPEGEGVNP